MTYVSNGKPVIVDRQHRWYALTVPGTTKMISTKLRIIAMLKGAIIAKGGVDLTINCARWDTILNLSYGSTKLHIAAAANFAGFDALVGLTLAELKYRTPI